MYTEKMILELNCLIVYLLIWFFFVLLYQNDRAQRDEYLK